MADGIEVTSGLRALSADLGILAVSALPNVAKAIEVTSRNVKDDWRQNAEQIDDRSAKAYPFSIDYDITVTAASVDGVIGPDLSKNQGALGILEEARGGVRGAPQGNARRALAKNVDDFERGILLATGSIAHG